MPDDKPLARRTRLIVRPVSSIVLAALLPVSIAIAAGDEPAALSPPDMSDWKCKFCEFKDGWFGDVNLGAGYVSDSSNQFGRYNGLNEEGAYAIIDANLHYRDENARYLDLSVADFGLDSRSLSIEGGRQGSFDVFFSYSELPLYTSDLASTPYLGSDGDLLTLPSDWVYAGSTAGMTALDQSLLPIDIGTVRKRLGAGIKASTRSPWSYSAEVRRDEKEGSKHSGGAFFFDSAQLVEPVDYVTDEIDVGVSYTAPDWQARVGYYVSLFNNENDSLTWENAYTPLVAGADVGELALPPDNEFQQLTLAFNYEFNEHNFLNTSFAIGNMEQNADFLPATQNTLLAVPSLPADSANAEVDTRNARIELVSALTDQLRLTTSYSYDDRDNKTPQLEFDWVTTDAFVGSSRTNQPYSITRDSLSLQAEYDLDPGTWVGIGFEREDIKRDYVEVEETREDTVSGNLRIRNINNLFLEFKLAFADRRGSDYQQLTTIDPPQNPLLIKFNLADRNRSSIGMYANLQPTPYYSVGFSIDAYQDDYDNSDLGLTESSSSSINLDVSAMPWESTSVFVFAGTQTIDSKQAGSGSYAEPDWFANNVDSFQSVGFGVTHVLIEDRLDIGADYTYAGSTGKITVNNSGLSDPFPDLRTRRNSIRLFANYHVNDELSLRMVYWHETYDVSDWALNGVDADTIPNLLAFGEDNGSYDTDVVKVSLAYTL